MHCTAVCLFEHQLLCCACSKIDTLVAKVTQSEVHWSPCSMFISSDLCLITDML